MNESKYESLLVWQKSHELAIRIYKTTLTFPKEEAFGLTSQLRRAALSVPTNIAEGYARQNSNVFRNFLDIAYGSLVETKYLIKFSTEIGLLNQGQHLELASLTEEVGALLWKFNLTVTSGVKNKVGSR